MSFHNVYQADVKSDLYGLSLSDGQTVFLCGDAARGDINPYMYLWDSGSGATDNFPAVIKPTSQMGNGRYLKINTDLIGAVQAYAGTSAPVGWLLCDGSAVSRTTYANLFAIISTTYGTGDGSTTYNVPDLRQRFPMGVAASGTGNALGATGGNIDHTHTISHTHQVDPPNTTSGAPSGTVAATNLTGSAASTTHTHDVNIPEFTSGGSSSANSGTANPPFIALNYIIKI
jgi:microcystin-dependent protein